MIKIDNLTAEETFKKAMELKFKNHKDKAEIVAFTTFYFRAIIFKFTPEMNDVLTTYGTELNQMREKNDIPFKTNN